MHTRSTRRYVSSFLLLFCVPSLLSLASCTSFASYFLFSVLTHAFYSFLQESEGGLFIDMTSFVGVSPEFALLNFQRTGHAVYLNIAKKRVPKKRVRYPFTNLTVEFKPISPILPLSPGLLNCHALLAPSPLFLPSSFLLRLHSPIIPL